MIGDCKNSQHLLRLAASHSAGERRVLADSLVDLLAETEPDLSEREAALIGDILNKLIRDFETAVRRELADRLAWLERAPHEVIVALANDEIEIAKPLLRQSPVLRDQDLIAIIHNRTRQHQMSIAVREMVSKAVSDALVETGDEAVITSLLSNKNARISDCTLAYLVEEARRVDSYREPLVLREDLSEDLAKRIYTFVAQDLGHRILQRFDLDPEILDEELIGLADALVAPAGRTAKLFTVDDAPERLAKALANSKEITPNFLVNVLRAGKIDLFEALIGELTGLDTPVLTNLLYDTNSKALATICRATGIRKKHFVELFLLIRRTQTRSKTTPTREIGTALRYFDQITPAGALQAVACWRRGGGAGATEKAVRSVR
jgi:uncharacterized protein (DUF2336 family)